MNVLIIYSCNTILSGIPQHNNRMGKSVPPELVKSYFSSVDSSVDSSDTSRIASLTSSIALCIFQQRPARWPNNFNPEAPPKLTSFDYKRTPLTFFPLLLSPRKLPFTCLPLRVLSPKSNNTNFKVINHEASLSSTSPIPALYLAAPRAPISVYQSRMGLPYGNPCM